MELYNVDRKTGIKYPISALNGGKDSEKSQTITRIIDGDNNGH